MKLYGGIDPGLDGGIVIIGDDLSVQEAIVMPVVTESRKRGARTSRQRRLDEVGVRKVLQRHGLNHDLQLVTLEALHRGHPGLRGVNSALTMGAHHGLLRGLLCGLHVPYLLTPARGWQAAMLPGPASGDTKARSVERAQQLFPHLNLTPGQRTKPHDGLSDAALLALYGMRQLHAREEEATRGADT